MAGKAFADTATVRRVERVALVAAAIGMGAFFPSYAAEQTLAVSLSGDTFTVSVPANAYDDTSKLYLVWGAIDCGEKISAWPRANRLEYSGAISATAATYQFSTNGIPAGSIVRAIVSSDVRLIDSWISLGNGQYVNTGIKGNAAYGVEVKFRRTGDSGTWASVIGSKIDNFTIGKNNNNTTSCYLRYQGVNGGLAAFSWSDETIPHTILLKHSLADNKGHVNGAYVDGTYVTLSFLDGRNRATTGPVGALGTDASDIFVGSANNGSGASCGRYYYAEWHHVRILDNNGYDMRHFVPAIRGNTSSPEGVFYDIVTETVFANAGSGTPGYDTAANVTETIPFTTAYSAAFPMALKAYWTGLGNLTNVNDPANWACTNAAGVEVSGAHPDTSSIVYVRGATNFNVPAGQRLAYNELNIENCSLATNCDWRGLAVSDTVDPIYTLQYADIPRGAYFDTGFAPNNNTRVVMDVTIRGSTESLFGITDDTSGNWWKTKCFGVSNDGGGIYSGFGNEGGTPSPVAANGRHIVDFDKGVLKIDGATHTTRSAQTFQLTRTMYLFADHRPNDVNIKSNNPAPRFHSCKIYDNGTLIRHYVPMQNNGYVCLYDRVNGTYVNNIGSGTDNIVAGPSLGDKVGFYNVTRPTDIDATIDLAGNSLTLAHAAGTGTITDTAGGGELHFNVASGETVENSTLTFTGQMKLVKDGAGTFVSARAQTYTGGTVANAGWLKQGAYSGAWGPHKSLITICKDANADTGAGFDWNGMANDSSTTAYSFKIAGTGPDGDAAMKTSAAFANNYWNANFIADMELDGDTTVKACHAVRTVYGFVYKNAYAHNLEMNGHTLTVAAGDAFGFRGVTVTGGGTIVSVPDTTQNTGMRHLSFYSTTNYLLTTTLDIHDRCGLNVEWPVIVTNLIDRRTLQWNDGTTDNNGVSTDKDSIDGMLVVIGRFQPHSTNLYTRTTLGDATHLSPTFDLSLLDDAFVEPAVGDIVLNFADGANVNVDVGSRAVAVGDKLVSWSAIPNCGFTLVYSGEERPIEAVARADGLYVKSSIVPAYAMLDMTAQTPDWVFYDVNGNVVSDWEDGVTAEMQVRFASYEEYLSVKAKNVSPLEYLLSGSFTLPEGSGTCDMSDGFDFTPGPGVTIDVAGRKLILPNSMVGGTSPFIVTSSVVGGELEVTVAGGTTITNTAMSLTGSLKLTKKGAGTFVGAKADQTCTGGTFVNAGLVKTEASTGAWGQKNALITVADGAAFDWAAKVNTAYNFDAVGTGTDGFGAVISTVNIVGHDHDIIGDMTLSGDTAISSCGAGNNQWDCFGFNYQGGGATHMLTMNNHTFTAYVTDRIAFRGVQTVGAGTIVVQPKPGVEFGYKQLSFYGASSDLSSVTLDLREGTAINVEAASKVGTFIDRRTVKGVGNDALFTVLDRFQPTGTNTLLKTIQLGDATHLSPTLDLGSVTGTYTRGSCTLSYPSGATVTVNLVGTRTDLPAIARTKDGSGNRAGYVLTWASKPANVAFALNEASKQGGYKLEATDTGLLLIRRIGMTIIVK